MPPEDFIVSQACSTKEDTPNYWYNALSVLGKMEFDWDYLLMRSSRGPRRVLSLLVYGQSDDLHVPERVIKRLFDALHL